MNLFCLNFFLKIFFRQCNNESPFTWPSAVAQSFDSGSGISTDHLQNSETQHWVSQNFLQFHMDDVSP